MQSTWESAHSAALRELVDKGVTFSEIARLLNERFGTAYTRNATIGRARRMGLSLPAPPDAGGVFQAPKRADSRRISKKRARILLHAPAKPTTQRRAAALQLRCVAITPRHLALVDLEADDCRYPYGGDAEGEPITFCGHPPARALVIASLIFI
jgi:GcrA cell cycle regulator